MTKKGKLFIGTFLVQAALLPFAGHAQDAAKPAAPAVPAAAPAAADDSTTVIVTGKFLDKNASSATKLKIPVMDTPVTVNAYSGSFMKAVEVTQVADLYKYMTGVQRAGNTGYDMTLRGFQTASTDRNAIMTDGLPGLTVRFGSPPTIGTDHVEVVKGPASIFYGQVQPGGFVNIVTKKPEHVPHTEIEADTDVSAAGYGRVGGGNVAVDTTGPVPGTDGVLLYRLIAQDGTTRGFRNYSYEDPLFIAPSFTWNVDSATHLTLQFEYRHTKTHYDSYLVAPNNDIANVAPISTTYEEPGDYQHETGHTVTALFAHDFSPHLHFNFNYRFVSHVDDAWGMDMLAITTTAVPQVTRRITNKTNTRSYSFGDTSLSYDFDIGPIANKMVVGYNAGREWFEFNRTQYYNTPTTGPLSLNVNVINPTLGLPKDYATYPVTGSTAKEIAALTDKSTAVIASGAYISDFLTFTPQLKAMVGLRTSSEDYIIGEKRQPNVPVQVGGNHNAITPSAGLIYEPSKEWSFYTNYSTAYTPVAPSNVDINGLYTFKPTTAAAVEIGVKADLFDHRLRASVADFDIKKKNVINTFSCPTFTTCSNQLGAAESKGQELEINAQPIVNWQILLGYSHVDARVTETNIANAMGAKLINVAPNNAHLWTRYDIDGGMFKNLGLGFGVTYVDKRAGLLPTATSTATLPLPAYTTADVALYYPIGNVDLTLKATNITNKVYYESAGSQGSLSIVPGTPATVILTARERF